VARARRPDRRSNEWASSSGWRPSTYGARRDDRWARRHGRASFRPRSSCCSLRRRRRRHNRGTADAARAIQHGERDSPVPCLRGRRGELGTVNRPSPATDVAAGLTTIAPETRAITGTAGRPLPSRSGTVRGRSHRGMPRVAASRVFRMPGRGRRCARASRPRSSSSFVRASHGQRAGGAGGASDPGFDRGRAVRRRRTKPAPGAHPLRRPSDVRGAGTRRPGGWTTRCASGAGCAARRGCLAHACGRGARGPRVARRGSPNARRVVPTLVSGKATCVACSISARVRSWGTSTSPTECPRARRRPPRNLSGGRRHRTFVKDHPRNVPNLSLSAAKRYATERILHRRELSPPSESVRR